MDRRNWEEYAIAILLMALSLAFSVAFLIEDKPEPVVEQKIIVQPEQSKLEKHFEQNQRDMEEHGHPLRGITVEENLWMHGEGPRPKTGPFSEEWNVRTKQSRQSANNESACCM